MWRTVTVGGSDGFPADSEPDSQRIPNRIPSGFRTDSGVANTRLTAAEGWSKNDYRMGVVAQLANGHSARRFSRISSPASPQWRVWGILDLLHSTYEASVDAPARVWGNSELRA